MRDNERKQTNFCGRIFFEFFSFFFSICFIIFLSTKGLLKNQPRERERERNDDADFVNPDFNKNDDSDDEKNERGWSSK